MRVMNIASHEAFPSMAKLENKQHWFVFEPYTKHDQQSKGEQKKKDKQADFFLLSEHSVVVASR